jgi:hypothetical protein
MPVTTEPTVYDGDAGSPQGLTPFGIFDLEADFVAEAPKVATFVTHRLGYPVLDVELTEKNIYTCFEEATLAYAGQVNQFLAREYMLSAQGMPTGSSLTGQNVVKTALPQIVRLSSVYGVEAQTGGDVEVKRGWISASAHVQKYDLKTLWADVSESSRAIEIRRIYHFMKPAIARYYDPFATTGLGLTNLMSEFGFDGYSPAVTFVMMPAYEDLLRLQAIELNDMIRKSAYSFTLSNNIVEFTPQMNEDWAGRPIFFDYMVVDDKQSGMFTSGSGSRVSDYSNIPYQHIPYNNINSIGRQWIYKYTLALAKELLGIIRSKYQRIPIPQAEILLDGEILRREATAEKEGLIKELRETLEQTGLKQQMLRQAEIAKATQEIFEKVPLLFYIG